jgi:hypothetical protein
MVNFYMPLERGSTGVSILESKSTSYSLLTTLTGRAASRRDQNASLSWGGVEHLIDTYEILCGVPDPNLLKWMTFRHGEKCSVQGWRPVEGGREAAGEALLVAKGSYEK